MKSIFCWMGLAMTLAAFSAACGGKDKPPLTPDSDLDGGIDPASVAAPVAPAPAK